MLSIIVPAHNEAAAIRDTLEAVSTTARQLEIEHELLVVDDASTDSTAAIAAAHGARVLHVTHRQIASTRNAGAAEARGDRLLFVDADTLVDAPVLTAAMAAMDRGVIAGGCRVRLMGKVRWQERVFTAALMQAFRHLKIAPGCFIFCTRNAFDAVGGFDERWFAGEDVAISRAFAAYGRFEILHEAVLTSDRKLRTFTVREHLRLLWRYIRGGRNILHSRDALEIWYDRRDQRK